MPDSHASYLNAMGIVQWRLRAGRTNGPAPRSPAEQSDEQIGGLDEEALRETVAVCTRCDLYQTRTQTVFGVGNPEADWMFVGEAPGSEEDRKGEPFVGRAGKLLDAMLASVGKAREDVYIANVLKCRPPDNRDPHGEEVRQCSAYLLQQIESVQPRLLVALGRFAAQSLLNTTRPIGKLRGEVFEHAATHIPLIVTYHPAYLLRNPLAKRQAWQDLCLIKRTSGPP
ncbi:MAG: Type-4 uracil-DNA glycosylase [Gammaproteobacteria bacterium]|nr:Type-4 uracil-DNA glycosylase [Gammaproteobacteria bacterium]